MVARPLTARTIPETAFWVIWVVVIALTIGNAVIIGPVLHENIAVLDNDTVMRLIMVRDWLGGQGWFDTVVDRLVPPEGTLMHWSRYIDAMIGGLITVLALALPADIAQTAAMVIWPVFLALILLSLIGFGTRRLIGQEAACFAMLCAIIWPFTSDFYFLPGRLDHHNVQILLIVVMSFAVIWPGRPLVSGAVAGVAAGFALAIGLETLAYIFVLGALLFARAQLRWTDAADRMLAAFCVALAGAAVLFFLGQTPPARWGAPVCDQLGAPILSLIAIAGLASVVPMILLKEQRILRLLASVVIVAIGCAIAWPVLGPCLGGPYGDLPPEVQEIISTSIVEAKPGLAYASDNVLSYLKMVIPVFGAIIVGGMFWRHMPRDTAAEQHRADVIGQLLILALVGILASFSQIRLLLMTSAAVPVLIGFILAILLQRYLSSRGSGDAVWLFAGTILLIQPGVLEQPIKALLPSAAPQTQLADTVCRDDTALAALDAVPPAIMLTPTNLGPSLILNTRHSSLSGPYHRNPAAFANGVLPFAMPEAEMRSYIAATSATHLLLCAGTTYDAGFARDLVEGASTDWLTPVAVPAAGDLMVFEIR